MHATHGHTSLKSRRKGGVDIDMTTIAPENHVTIYIPFDEYNIINVRKTKQITYHIIRGPDTPEVRSRPMMIFSFSRSRDRREQRLRRRWTSSPKTTTRARPPAPLILLILLLLTTLRLFHWVRRWQRRCKCLRCRLRCCCCRCCCSFSWAIISIKSPTSFPCWA